MTYENRVFRLLRDDKVSRVSNFADALYCFHLTAIIYTSCHIGSWDTTALTLLDNEPSIHLTNVPQDLDRGRMDAPRDKDGTMIDASCPIRTSVRLIHQLNISVEDA